MISLRGHQQAEQALEDFLGAPAGRGYYTAALSKALGVGTPVVAAASRRLNSAQPDHLLRIGDLLARFPSRQRVAQALARAAHDPRAAGERRLGAFMLLAGLHLEGQVDDEAIYEIPEAGETLAETLVSLAGECVGRVEHASDYGGFFRFILSQPPDVLYGAVGALVGREGSDGGERARAALRLLAMHPHPELAEAAIEGLALDDSPRAAHDLSVLARNLPPDLARLAERHLRKRMLSGLTPRSLPRRATSGRALLSAIDGAGRQVLWVRWPNNAVSREGDGEATLLIVLSDTVGIATASAARQALSARFPPETRGAPTVWRPIDSSSALVTSTFVEAGLDYALRLLSEAARANWVSGTPIPIEYALMMSSLWSAGGLDAGQSTGSSADDLEEGSPPPVESESDLLSNPMLEGWYIDSHGVRAVARDVRAMGSTANALTHDNWRILLPALIRLAHDEFGPELRALYARRLRLMSEWFRMGGQGEEAEMAASAARTMVQSPPEANLLVLRLLQRGVLMALGDWG